MKTEIVLCDKCKDRVAKEKCVICDKDVCEGCSEMIPIQFSWNEQEFGRFRICKICKQEILKMLKEKLHDIKKFNDMIIKYIRDNMVLEELQK